MEAEGGKKNGREKEERGTQEKYDCPSREFPSIFANERSRRPFSAYNERSAASLVIRPVKTQPASPFLPGPS